MSQALYSKYRPKLLSDVVGQKHILQTIKNAIESNKISHAYMFCGPRGTGKTTMARLLAKACTCKNDEGKSPTVNFCGTCVDCTDIANGVHPDVYELDAASRTGVENVREEIISRVGYAATRGEKKIYIIDEVHMLSTAAFNALLKTLEEPPAHVIFILCTTDPQKVPETILSRCQRFDFASISASDILERLKFVCESEGVQAEEAALLKIAKKAQGAMRNALTSLEQIIAFTNGQITVDNINDGFSTDSQINFCSLIEHIGMCALPEIFEWCNDQAEKGADFNKICLTLTQIVRDMYVKSVGGPVDSPVFEGYEKSIDLFTPEQLHRMMIVLSDLANEMKISTNVRLSFEIAMAKIANPKGEYSYTALAQRIAQLEKIIQNGQHVMQVEPQTEPKVDLQAEPQYEPKSAPQTELQVEPKAELQTEPMPEPKPKKIVNFVSHKEKEFSATKDVLKEESKNTMADNNFKPKDVSSSAFEEITGISAPQRPKAVDFRAATESIKNSVSTPAANSDDKKDLTNDACLQKLWRAAFSNIRNKYPAFGATLITANASYDETLKKFVLKFPQNASFSVGVLKKPDSLHKIEKEIQAVLGDVSLSIEINNNSQDSFSPRFENNFRKNQNKQDEQVNTETNNLQNQDINFSSSSLQNEQYSGFQKAPQHAKENFVNDTYSQQSSPSYEPSQTQNNVGFQGQDFSEDTSDENSSTDKIKSMLNSYGAYNITEE